MIGRQERERERERGREGGREGEREGEEHDLLPSGVQPTLARYSELGRRFERLSWRSRFTDTS